MMNIEEISEKKAAAGSASSDTAEQSPPRAATSVELLDAAVWREIGSDEPQPPATFVAALATLVGRWLIVRSNTPEMDLITVMCRARADVERRGQVQSQGADWTR